MKIVIRPFNKEYDSGVIFSSYPKGVYHGSYKEITEEKKQWFIKFFEKVKDQLFNTDNVMIACMEDSPDTILGYLIICEYLIQFIYVKELFRKQGIASLMLKKSHWIGHNEEHLTKIGKAILDDKEKKHGNR